MRKWMFWMVLLLLPLIGRAQTTVSGTQTGRWLAANSPYLVTGEITVPAGDTLHIEPGVEVLFQGNYRFRIAGRLFAAGTETDSIYFAPDSGVSGWGGLRFVDADNGSFLKYCRITGGHAFGDWPDNSGGGISLWNTDVVIQHCRVDYNSADHHGGGLFCWGAYPTVTDCQFVANSAVYDGGGVYLYFSGGRFTNCEFSGNTTGYYGAAVCGESAYTPRFERCVMHHNQAGSEAGGLRAGFSEMHLVNCTIADNSTSGWGGGIYLVYTTVTLTNSIVWNNTGYGDPIYLDVQGQAVVNYSDAPGNWGGQGNLNVDPQFVQSSTGNYQLKASSPCVDAGTAFWMVNGDTLIALDSTQFSGNAPDMGAFEYISPNKLPNTGISVPERFVLRQNYPNPFNPVTTIRFALPRTEQVTLVVYDIHGREIRTLLDARKPAGRYQIRWDGTNQSGVPVASGVYFYRLQAGRFVAERKMILMR